MSDTDTISPEKAREKITELVRSARICMLTTMTADGRHVSRPMGLQEAEFDGDLWFFLDDTSDKADEIRRQPRGQRLVLGRRQARLGVDLRQRRDHARRRPREGVLDAVPEGLVPGRPRDPQARAAEGPRALRGVLGGARRPRRDADLDGEGGDHALARGRRRRTREVEARARRTARSGPQRPAASEPRGTTRAAARWRRPRTPVHTARGGAAPSRAAACGPRRCRARPGTSRPRRARGPGRGRARRGLRRATGPRTARAPRSPARAHERKALGDALGVGHRPRVSSPGDGAAPRRDPRPWRLARALGLGRGTGAAGRRGHPLGRRRPAERGQRDASLGDLHDDAAEVRAAVDRTDAPALVVAHSYGGLPVERGPRRERERRPPDLSGGVHARAGRVAARAARRRRARVVADLRGRPHAPARRPGAHVLRRLPARGRRARGRGHRAAAQGRLPAGAVARRPGSACRRPMSSAGATTPSRRRRRSACRRAPAPSATSTRAIRRSSRDPPRSTAIIRETLAVVIAEAG